MNLCVSVLLILCLNGNVVRSNEYWDYTSSKLLFLPSLDSKEECIYNIDVVSEFRYALIDFSTKIFKSIAVDSKNHFDLSPLSMWMSLAAIAEGSAGNARQELFQLLNLPEDKCVRHEFYTLANSREYPKYGEIISRKRLLIVDEGILLNKNWEHFVSKNRLIETVTVPLTRSPERSLDFMREITSTQLPNIDLSGNSVILDTFDYVFILNTDLKAVKVEREPFYNDFNEEIGHINMIKFKKQVKLAYLPELKLKVLELTDGYNGRYRLYYCISYGNNSSIDYSIDTFKNDIMFKILKNLRTSKIPLEINIPQYSSTTEIDVKTTLEKLGVKTLWNDFWATRKMSNPPVFPSSFVQRVTLTLGRPTHQSLVQETSKFVPAIDDLRNANKTNDDVFGEVFIVNKPFVLALFDAELYTCLMTSALSKPSSI